MRYAAIDIGTVTCRMLVADVENGHLIELAKEYAITNLGEDVDATGMLKPQAMQRVAHVIDGYLQVLDNVGDGGRAGISLTTMATSASRDAGNADEFVALLAQRGVTLTVIPGWKEAELSFKGASCDFPGERIAVVDIGGGSTEIVVGSAGERPVYAKSFNVGCRRVTEKFLHNDPPSQTELQAARAWIREILGEFVQLCESSQLVFDRVVAVAGTATSVVSIRDRMEVYDSARVHRAKVSSGELAAVTSSLASMALDQRKTVTGLDPQRAPVIVAGLLILEEVLNISQADGFTASEADILQGIILDAAQARL